MAPELRRWGMRLTLACAALALAYLPPRGARGARWRGPVFVAQLAPRTPERLRAQGLADEWRAAQAAVRLEEQRRAFRALPAGRTEDAIGPTLLVAGGELVPATVRVRLAANLDTVWHRLGLGETKIAVGVVLDVGNAGPVAGLPAEDRQPAAYLLPDATDRTTCLVRVAMNRSWTRWVLGSATGDARLQQWLTSTLGPCAFLAAYGAPGRPARRWLTRRGFDLALLPAWDAAPRADPMNQLLIIGQGRWWWDYVYHQAPIAVGCLAGREAACREAVLAEAAAERLGDSLARVVVQDRDWWRRQRLVGGVRYLADVARDIGPERFREFWSSTLPVDSSLALALRQPVGRWTAAWQLQTVPRLRLGPSAPLPASVLAMLLGAGAVALAALAAGRRQVR